MTASDEVGPKSTVRDHELERILSFLQGIPEISTIAARAVRQAVDEIIDGPRTGRYSLVQLDKEEKAYIGKKVEVILRDELSIPRGQVLDCLIEGVEVDIKHTIRNTWMVPPEAVGNVLLLIQTNDDAGWFSLGLMRALDEFLTQGGNQDKKRSVSKSGKENIHWIAHRSPLPPNLLHSLDHARLERILSKPSAQERVNELFRSVQDTVVSRTALATVAGTWDYPRRLRDTVILLQEEGISVYRYKDKDKLADLGLPIPGKGEAISHID